MSYDAWMQIDTGGSEKACVDDIGNMTSNVSPMWTKALGFRLRDLQDKLGADCVPHLLRAVQHIRAPENRADYEAMNPSNGWGNHAHATEFLEKLLSACERHPKAELHFWY